MAGEDLKLRPIETQKPPATLKTFNLNALKVALPLYDARRIDNQIQDTITNNSGVSLFGTPVFANLQFPIQTVQDLDGNSLQLPNVALDGVLMTVTQTKNIITTPIQGRNGTVKEYISDGDYNISVQGVVSGRSFNGFKIDDGNVYPETDVNSIIQIVKAPAQIRITSDFLDLFGISEVVVTDYDFPQTRGLRDNQAFTISLLSDQPIELQPAGNPNISFR